MNKDRYLDLAINILSVIILYIFSAILISFVTFNVIYFNAMKDLSPIDRRSPQVGFIILVFFIPVSGLSGLIGGIPGAFVLSFLLSRIKRRFIPRHFEIEIEESDSALERATSMRE